MSHSATGAVCEHKNLMYIYLIKVIPDIGYDIRYDIMYDIIYRSLARIQMPCQPDPAHPIWNLALHDIIYDIMSS
jgi:hypothetical protein